MIYLRIKTQELYGYTNNVYRKSTKEFQTSVERLSTGIRINRAADDNAGLQVSTRLKTKVNTLEVAKSNIDQATNLLKTADGGLSSIADIIMQIKELTIRAQNDTYTPEQKAFIQTNVNELVDEIARISSGTRYNGMELLNKDSGISLAASVTNPLAPSLISFPNASFIPTSGTQARTYDMLVQVDGINQSWPSNPVIRLFDTQKGYLAFHSSNKEIMLRTDSGFVYTGVYLPMGEKVRVSLTYENSNASLYINGEKRGTYIAPSLTSQTTFNIGDTFNPYREGVIGTFYEASYYLKALTDQEILNNYQGRNTSNAVGSWQFNEDNGTLIKDTSGNGNDGKLVGNTTRVIGSFRVNTGGYATDSRTIPLSSVTIDDLKLTNLDITNSNSFKVLDNALERVNNYRVDIGTELNRLGYNLSNTQTSITKQSTTLQRIADTDVTEASSNLIKAQIQVQSAMNVLIKEKEHYQSSLQLLQS